MTDHLQTWTLLPPAPDKCQECAVAHEPEMPHDAQSLYYLYSFYAREGRWPTWADAVAHCDEISKQAVRNVLREHGLEVNF